MAKATGPQDSMRAATQAVRHAADEANRVVHTSMDDVERTAKESAPGTALLGSAAFLGIAGFSALVVGISLKLSSQRAWGPLLIGGVLLGVGGACAAAGAASFPKRPFARTRDALRHDLSSTADALR